MPSHRQRKRLRHTFYPTQTLDAQRQHYRYFRKSNSSRLSMVETSDTNPRARGHLRDEVSLTQGRHVRRFRICTHQESYRAISLHSYASTECDGIRSTPHPRDTHRFLSVGVPFPLRQFPSRSLGTSSQSSVSSEIISLGFSQDGGPSEGSFVRHYTKRAVQRNNYELSPGPVSSAETVPLLDLLTGLAGSRHGPEWI